jgi:hypothetical protein
MYVHKFAFFGSIQRTQTFIINYWLIFGEIDYAKNLLEKTNKT